MAALSIRHVPSSSTRAGTRTSGLKARIASASPNTDSSSRSKGMPSTYSEMPTRRTNGKS